MLCFHQRPKTPEATQSLISHDSSTQCALDNTGVPAVGQRLGAIPKRNTAQVRNVLANNALHRRRHLVRRQIPGPSASRASRGANVELGLAALGREISGPFADGVSEARSADVAVAVVVELDKDEVHGKHGVERDGGVRAWALGRAGDEVLAGRVAGEGLAEGVDKGGVVGGHFVFVV